MATKSAVLEDTFEVLEKDPDGKKFDKVSRIKARSDLYEMDLVLDVNVDVYPIEVGDKLGLCLASTLQLDGGPTSASFDVSMQSGRPTLMDKYEYVMHGRVFKFKDSTSSGQVKADVYISFGGLLMQLTGDPRRLEDIDVDQNIYLLIRKI